MSKIYFKGLDGLRGIAAILVVFGHVELIKKSFNYKNVYDGDGLFFLYLGGHAVTFFFVLSGFLITFLLLKERAERDKINIKNFYIRRILRIWPVYYLLFICGFFLLPLLVSSPLLLPKIISEEDYWNSFIFNLALLPNFSKVSNPVAFQSWSIGVEEQFYIFWPLIISRINSLKRLLVAMIGIIFGIYLLRSGIYFNNFFELNMPFLDNINKFFGESRFDNMAIGGVLAIIFYKKPNYKLSLGLKLLIAFLVITILLKTATIGFGLDNPIAAIVFAGLIYWVVKVEHNMVLENKVIIYLGKISYGIYMYHVIGIILAINIVIRFNPFFDGKGIYFNLLLYLLSMIITIFISYLSYHFMEKRILKFKNRISN